MKAIAMSFAVLLLSGCSDDGPLPPQHATDQCLRRDLFQSCMKALSAGPATAKYNDWDEVVDSCEGAAYYQSQRLVRFIKPECRP